MKKSLNGARSAKSLDDLMTVRFKAVLDSVVRLREQWDRAIRDMQRAHAEELRVTRMVLRDHNRRLRSIESKLSK